MRNWLNSRGEFLFGKYEGEYAEDIMRDDPDYIRWITENADDIDEEDQQIFLSLLERRGR